LIRRIFHDAIGLVAPFTRLAEKIALRHFSKPAASNSAMAADLSIVGGDLPIVPGAARPSRRSPALHLF
jgi:hypothetical protein